MLQSLVRGGPTCCGAAACHNYWCPHTRACARNNEESRAHPERRPCLLPQRRPASSSGGPAQPRVPRLPLCLRGVFTTAATALGFGPCLLHAVQSLLNSRPAKAGHHNRGACAPAGGRRCWAHAPQLRKAVSAGARASREKPPQGEARTPHPEERACSLQPEEARTATKTGTARKR
uniref:Uncharacterized protein n=1 Tax=Rangifer tarandus platyrhynchus TaxID=3082113 RepID=A0ACB0FHS9_RANTA|nr:unnamed protein product [Rangifer tarandus platyrhynchus]